MDKPRPQILLTNDDGIQSPGLWAAADALSTLGYVTVAAPRDQSSGTGRSLPITSDGTITPTQLIVKNQEWTVYAVGGTPAQSVQHAILEIMPHKPDLVVSGINYGENLGTSIAISGTVGAAMEAAELGVPALAASLELIDQDFYGYSTEVDFSTAAFFTHLFAKYLLENPLPSGVDLLKLDVPSKATPQTPWRITRLGRHPYFVSYVEGKRDWSQKFFIPAKVDVEPGQVSTDSDIHTMRFEHQVTIVPLTLDMTAQVNLHAMEEDLRNLIGISPQDGIA
jgi:5'-nucleotidase